MTSASNRAGPAIAFVLVGVLCISLNDMLIKQLSSGYPLHQIVFFRSFVAIMVSLVFLRFEGGLAALRTALAQAPVPRPPGPTTANCMVLSSAAKTCGSVTPASALASLVPVENAAMPERTVIQWDKDDLEALGLLRRDPAIRHWPHVQQQVAALADPADPGRPAHSHRGHGFATLRPHP